MFRKQPFGGHRVPSRLGYVVSKTIVLLALLGAAGWFYFDRQSKFSDSHILEYVKTSIEAERAMDAQKSCDLLAEDAEISKHMSRAELTKLCDPANYLGQAGEMVDRVLAMRDRGA